MTTTVTAQPPPGCAIPDDAFAAITTKPVLCMEWVADGLAVTFDGDLSDAEAEQVAKRITARDDADWSRREALLAQVDAASSLSDIQAAVAALVHYLFDKEG